jgi:hypothetical protein
MQFEFDTVATAVSIAPATNPIDIINGNVSPPSSEPMALATGSPSEITATPKPTLFEFNMSAILEPTESDCNPTKSDDIRSQSDVSDQQERQIDFDYWIALDKWELECLRAPIAFAHKIEELEKIQTAAAIEMKERKDEYKDAADAHKLALQNLCNKKQKGIELPEKPTRESFIPKPTPIVSPPQPDASATNDTPASAPVLKPAPNTSELWRKVPASEVLKGIKGLGSKKLDALLALFVDLGEMEDLRGKASIQHKHFSELLPDGIGEGMADKIEEAMYQAQKNAPIE